MVKYAQHGNLKLRVLGYIVIGFVLASCQKTPHRIYVKSEYPDSSLSINTTHVSTIQHALDSVARLNMDGIKGSIEILLSPGTHYLEAPLELTSAHSGTNEYPLTIQPTGDSEVIISGAQRLDLEWVQIKDSLWQTNLEAALDFDQLYINGQKQIRARYPNCDTTVLVYNGYAADAIAPTRTLGWNNPETGILHAMHVAEWGDYHYQITGSDKKGNVTLEGGFQNNRQMGMHPEYRYVENIREELDAPGEWFYDQNTGRLSFIRPHGLNMDSLVVEIPILENLIKITGTSDAPVQNIVWQRCTFRHTRHTFMKTNEPLLRSDWMIHRGGAIFLEGTENIRFENNFLDQVGGNGIFISGYNRRAMISGNRIRKPGASGVCLVGRPEAVRSPSLEYHEFVDWQKLDRTTGPKDNTYPLDCIVRDNLIHDIGRVEKQVAGIQISMAMGITASHNSIYNTPRAGINIGDGTWGGHVIEYNDVFNTVLETGDHGAFNSWGRDRFWHPNRSTMNTMVKEDPSLILLDAVDTTVIRNNRFRCDHGWDIDLDDGSSNYHIYNNLCLNGGIKLREGFYRTVENNIMINNSFHPHVWFENSHDIFRHNIVSTRYKPIRVSDWGDQIDYNLLPDSSALAFSQKLGLDQHSLYGAPQYIDPKSGNFKVSTKSPALQVGFVNFSMDEFGVFSPDLKKLAQSPEIPVLYPVGKEDAGATFEFLGAQVKKLQGAGERSATGMDGERGILVLKTPTGSLAGTQGLIQGDVILALNNQETNSMRQLLEAYQGERWKGNVDLTVFRNQSPMKLNVTLRK